MPPRGGKLSLSTHVILMATATLSGKRVLMAAAQRKARSSVGQSDISAKNYSSGPWLETLL